MLLWRGCGGAAMKWLPTVCAWLAVLLSCTLADTSQAQRRSVRVEGFPGSQPGEPVFDPDTNEPICTQEVLYRGTWGSGVPIPSLYCPGTQAGSTLLVLHGHEFAGRNAPEHLADAYCQNASIYREFEQTVYGPYNDQSCSADLYLGSNWFPWDVAYAYDDEPGMAELMRYWFERYDPDQDPGVWWEWHPYGQEDPYYFPSPSLIQDIRATRYAFLDAPRFAEAPDPVPTGFQWIVYSFSIDGRNDVSLVSLHGLQDTPLDSRSYIQKDGVRVWDGGRDGYNGEYFCFEGERYLGTWNGQPGSASACQSAVFRIFKHTLEE